MKYTRLLLSLFSFFIFLSLAYSVQATNYYISPTGNDVNNGTSESTPIRNFTKAWQLLFPGDTLILLDGTYYQTMAPNVRDGAPNPDIDTSDYITYPLDHPLRTKNYITIKAKNDGKAIIDGQNQRRTVSLGDYTQNWVGYYYVLEGLVAKNSDYCVYDISSRNVVIKRTSGFNANTHLNDHVYCVWGVSGGGSPDDPANILLEDNFASGRGRKMFMGYGTYVNVIFRRNAGLTLEVPLVDQACQNDWPNGDNIEIYNWNQQDISNNSIVENNIALGGTPTYGFSLAPNPARTIGNKVLGNISIRGGMNINDSDRVWSGNDMAPACKSHGTACAADGSSNWLYHRTGFQFGIYANPFFKNNLFQDLFAWGNASFGLTAGGNWCDGTEPAGTYPCARCNSVENNANENCAPGQLTSSERSSNNVLNRVTLAYNSIAAASPYNNSGIEVPESSLDTFRTYGTLGSMYVEGDSRFQDKSKGARLRYRYVNGVLMDGTNGQPAQELWPWPMEARIKDELAREFGIQNYSVTNSIVPLINQHTAVQVPLGPTPTGPTSTPQPTNTSTPVPPSPTPVLTQGDVNGDGNVNLTDLSTLLSNFGRSGTVIGREQGDLDGNGS